MALMDSRGLVNNVIGLGIGCLEFAMESIIFGRSIDTSVTKLDVLLYTLVIAAMKQSIK
jgi:hypothetical protein